MFKKIFVLTFMFLVSLSSLGFCYTYDSDIDPSKLQSWARLTPLIEIEPGLYVIHVKNITGEYKDYDQGFIFLLFVKHNNSKRILVLAYSLHSISKHKFIDYEYNPINSHYTKVNKLQVFNLLDNFMKRLKNKIYLQNKYSNESYCMQM